jgi:1-phosphatidylinositol-3-phosphate 5-kinase
MTTPTPPPSDRYESPILPGLLTPHPHPPNSSIADKPSAKHTVTRSYSSVSESLQTNHKQHQIDLLKQLLKLKNLNPEWFDVIMPLVWQCVDLVRPDVKHDNDLMDIRNYIKIKKLPGFEKSRSRIVNGLVFTKNVAHKKMNADMKNPKVLLLRSSIEYQRSEEKMSSLEPIFTAESQYLKNYCSKLLLRQNPEILIVEKSVARIAQEMFLQSNVSLVLNVKSNIMDKLCRFLQADPMFSIDDVLRKPKLGVCSHFHIENVKLASGRVKPLMLFEGTPTNLGCTILLYGNSLNELNVVKSVTRFMIYAVYNSKLEQSFMFDKSADFFVKAAQVELRNIPSIARNRTEKETSAPVVQVQAEVARPSTANQVRKTDQFNKFHLR